MRKTPRSHRPRITVKNPAVSNTIACENPSVRQLARLFNTADVHSRRALLQHAARMADTVTDEVALELGTVAPQLVVGIRPRADAPAGLRAMFSLLVLDGYKPVAATNACRAAYPHAVRIADAVLTNGDEGIVVEEIKAAVETLFPNLEEPVAITTAQEAAFNVGFAVCWLLMVAMNGRGGAR